MCYSGVSAGRAYSVSLGARDAAGSSLSRHTLQTGGALGSETTCGSNRTLSRATQVRRLGGWKERGRERDKARQKIEPLHASTWASVIIEHRICFVFYISSPGRWNDHCCFLVFPRKVKLDMAFVKPLYFLFQFCKWVTSTLWQWCWQWVIEDSPLFSTFNRGAHPHILYWLLVLGQWMKSYKDCSLTH